MRFPDTRSTRRCSRQPLQKPQTHRPIKSPHVLPLTSCLQSGSYVCLIRQCRFLESSLNTNFTSRILSSHQEFSFSQLKKEIIEVDFSLLLSEASNHASQRYMQAVAPSPISSWPKVWDSALEKGAFGTSCSLALLRLLSLHTYSDNKCPVPNCSYVVDEDSLCSHFLADHTTLSITAEQCVYFLENCSEEIYSYGKTLNQIFRNIWN